MTNITREAVEAMADRVADWGCGNGSIEAPAMLRALLARVDELSGALRDVREEICTGPVDDVLWHSGYPVAETTVDFITNTLGDDWTYDEWVEKQEASHD